MGKERWLLVCARCNGDGYDGYEYVENVAVAYSPCRHCGGFPHPVFPDGLYRVVGGKVERVEADEAVTAMARAMQIENRPSNDALNAEQRAAQDSRNLPAYKALARAALKALGAS